MELPAEHGALTRIESLDKLKKVLDSISAIIFIIDSESRDILFANQHTAETWGNIAGKKCWQVMGGGRTRPCDLCADGQLMETAGSLPGKCVSDSFCEKTGRWYECRSLATWWVEGRMIRLGIAHDITDRRQAEERLSESEGRYRALVETQMEGLCRWLPVTTLTFVNKAYCDFYGKDASSLLGTSWLELVPEAARKTVKAMCENLVANPRLLSYEHPVVGHDGNIYWQHRTDCPIFDKSGNLVEFQSVGRNITDRKQAEERLRISEARWQFALEGAGDGVWDWNLTTNQVFYSSQWKTILGYSDDEIGNTIDEWALRIHPEDKERWYEDLKKHFRGDTKVFLNEHRILCKDGTYKWMLDRGKVVERGHDGEPLRVIGTCSDITEHKRYEEQLKYLSLHDRLTGLYNRTFFEEELRRLVKCREYPISILSIDVNGLKFINDTLGYERGDELLRSCAGILRQSLRGYDIVARVGGDEFAAILCRTDEKAGQRIADRICSNVNLYNTEHVDLHLSISMGVATADPEGASLQEAYKKAEELMYRDKLRHSASTKSQIVSTVMATLAERDFITEGHAQRLSELCLLLGQKIGLSPRQLNDLALLAQVHDLGKVGIPDSILFKKGPLANEEWKIMHQHPEKGYRIASCSHDLAGVADLILKHHERWDGTGYPLGLKGEEIPIECRILAIVDAFDAMTSDRPYRKAKSKEEAISELKRCSGSQFDPVLVKAFISLTTEI